MRFDVLDVEGNRIEKLAVWFEERPRSRGAEGEFQLSPEDQLE
jgi:hypothetical protein